MRSVVAIDLAAKYSAGVVINQNGKMIEQWDSLGWTHCQVVEQLLYSYMVVLDGMPMAVVEDLPPRWGAVTDRNTKTVLQLQGRILHEFDKAGYLSSLWFVVPSLWQREMGVYRVTPEEAEAVAAGLGYAPPDLLLQRELERGTRGQATAIKEADKQRTDYVAAFLLASWAQQHLEANTSAQIKQYLP